MPVRLLLAGLLLLDAALPARATALTGEQDSVAYGFADTGWQGCSALVELARAEIGAERVVVTAELDWSHINPRDAILVLHPRRPLRSGPLSAFLHQGGRLALLDDYGAGDRILEPFHFRRTPAPATPSSTLRHNMALPLAEPVVQPDGVHPVVQGVERLMTNHPTTLVYEPTSSETPTPVLVIRTADGEEAVLAYAGDIGARQTSGSQSNGQATSATAPAHGKLFVMGDPSVLINQMLRYPGNRAFATGLLHYLAPNQSPSGGPEGGKVYLLANDVTDTGELPGDASLRSRIDAVLVDVERYLRRTVGPQGLGGPLGLVLSAALSLAAGAWALRHAARLHRPHVPAFARTRPLVAQGGQSGRAAVLSADSTPRALALLEVHAALHESLAHELGLSPLVAGPALLDALRQQQALDEASLHAFKGVLADMARIETLILAKQRAEVGRDDLARAAKTAARLLATVQKNLRRDRSEQ